MLAPGATSARAHVELIRMVVDLAPQMLVQPADLRRVFRQEAVLVVRRTGEPYDVGAADGRVVGDGIRGQDTIGDIGFFTPKAGCSGGSASATARFRTGGAAKRSTSAVVSAWKSSLSVRMKTGHRKRSARSKATRVQAVAFINGAGGKRYNRIAARRCPSGRTARRPVPAWSRHQSPDPSAARPQ